VIQRAFATRNEASGVEWMAAQWQVPLRCRVMSTRPIGCGVRPSGDGRGLSGGIERKCYVASSAGVRTCFIVAMAHDHLLVWLITCPPPGQTAVDFILFLPSFVLPYMLPVLEGREWSEHPERCALFLDNARIHDEAALTVVRAAGVVLLLLPPYSPDFNPTDDDFAVGSIWFRRWSIPEKSTHGLC